VNFPCMFTTNMRIGNYGLFNGMNVRGIGRLTVGNYFHSGDGFLVRTKNNNYRKPQCRLYDHVNIARGVTIEDYAGWGLV